VCFILALVGCETSKTGTTTTEQEGVVTSAETGGEAGAAATEGGSETATTETAAVAAKNYDPCALVTQAEAEAALGIALKISKHETTPPSGNPLGQKICYYEDASGKEMKFVQISINEGALFVDNLKQSNYGVAELYKGVKDAIQNAVAVPGVGDDAVYGGSGLKLGAGVTTLVKAKGVMMNVTVGLGLGNTDDDAHIKMEKDLALKAVARL
ncbi:MAG: DUF3558 family protein, partial [bacterium]